MSMYASTDSNISTSRDVSFEANVLMQLQSIVESQSMLLESQSRLTTTIEAFQDRFQAERPAMANNHVPLTSWDASPLASTSVTEYLSELTEGQFTPKNIPRQLEDPNWPASIRARYSKSGTSPVARETPRSRVSYLSWSSAESGIPFVATRWVILPDSRLQTFLDLMGVIFVMLDLTTTSFFLSWGVVYSRIFWTDVCVSPPYWTLDIVRHFLMASYQKGELETRWIAIATLYLKSYFFIDLFVVLFDWASVALLTSQPSDMQSNTILRAMQFIKMIRIIQLSRMTTRLLRRWDMYAERRFGERNQLIMSYLIVPVCFILAGLHLVACLYYAVGAARLGYNGRSWFEKLDDPESGITFVQSSLINQYLAVYHFAVATVSLAGNFEIPVTNPSERGVMILTLLLGFVFGSVFVSSISAAIVDYQIKENANSSRLRQLRKYLVENHVKLATYERVVMQAEQRLVASDRLKEEDVNALTFMSKQFIIDVRLEIQWPPLRRHALFRLYEMLDEDVPRRLCNHALSYIDLSVGDELFREGEVAEYAYILTFGILQYVPSQSRVERLLVLNVDPYEMLSEATLFVLWFHVGRARAQISSRVLKINAVELTKVVVDRDPVIRSIAMEYGCEFHRRITATTSPPDRPNDLYVHSADYCEVVLALPAHCQVEIGKCALRTLSHTHSQALLDEVLATKAVVILTGGGDVYRIKSIVVLKIEDERGPSVLAQIAKVKRKSVSPSVTLPACTCEKEESLNDCLERVLKSKFHFLDGKVDVDHTDHEVMETESKEFSVRTRYYRTVVCCKLRYNQTLGLPAVIANVYKVPSTSSSYVGRVGSRSQDPSVSPLRHNVVVDWDDKENGTLYAWLSETDFEYLKTAGGTEWLKGWLSACDLDPPPLSYF